MVFHFFTTAAQWNIRMKDGATLGFGLKFGLARAKVVQKLVYVLFIWITQWTLTERLLLRWDEKWFVYLWHFVIILALTRVLLNSFSENVVLLIFIKYRFLLLLVLVNTVFDLSEAADSILKWRFSHRRWIVEADSVNSLFRRECFA